MAASKTKQISETQAQNQQHKRIQHHTNQIKEIQHRDDLIVTKADKNKALIIIERETLNQKINTFLQENDITQINKDPTKTYQEQIQQVLQTCNLIIERGKNKHLINRKPAAPKLSAYIKTHKEGTPIRPVINSIQAPSYKLAKYLNKKLQGMQNLPSNYNTKNSKEVALELFNTQTKDYHRTISLDIKDLYVNIPIKDILRITKIWLQKQRHNNKIIEQTTHAIETILKQNYLQYDNRFYQPKKGIAMGSLISGTRQQRNNIL
jgi:hypothetical protein